MFLKRKSSVGKSSPGKLYVVPALHCPHHVRGAPLRLSVRNSLLLQVRVLSGGERLELVDLWSWEFWQFHSMQSLRPDSISSPTGAVTEERGKSGNYFMTLPRAGPAFATNKDPFEGLWDHQKCVIDISLLIGYLS